MGLGDSFVYCEYNSDNGDTYIVKLSNAVATAGNFTQNSDPLSLPGYPFGPKNMRHVWGRDSAGHRTKLPCDQPGNTLFQSGGTFTLHGRNYTVLGAIGEKRALSALGG